MDSISCCRKRRLSADPGRLGGLWFHKVGRSAAQQADAAAPGLGRPGVDSSGLAVMLRSTGMKAARMRSNRALKTHRTPLWYFLVWSP